MAIVTFIEGSWDYKMNGNLIFHYISFMYNIFVLSVTYTCHESVVGDIKTKLFLFFNVFLSLSYYCVSTSLSIWFQIELPPFVAVMVGHHANGSLMCPCHLTFIEVCLVGKTVTIMEVGAGQKLGRVSSFLLLGNSSGFFYSVPLVPTMAWLPTGNAVCTLHHWWVQLLSHWRQEIFPSFVLASQMYCQLSTVLYF